MTTKSQPKNAMRAHGLNLLCDQILETIHESALSSSAEDADKEALKREYNRLSNELEELRQAPAIDPLARLPPEVWTEIIREAAEENDINLLSTDVLLLLTLVSREWRTKILGTARLWTNITIGRGEADAQAKLASALYFTGHREFRLTIDVPPCQWEDDLSILQAHTARIKKLTFRLSERGDFHKLGNESAGARCIEDLFTSLGHLPSLKALHGPGGLQLNWNGVFERCPNLTYMRGTAIPLKDLQTRNQVPIHACYVDAPLKDIIPRLEDFVYLEELEWESKSIIDVDICGKYGFLPSLPALRHVLSYNIPSADILILLGLTERLTRLRFTIEGNWQHLYDFLLLLEHLHHLRDLELYLEYVERFFSFPVNRVTKSGVQYLQFMGPYIELDRNEERNTAFINQEALFSVFPFCFPGVRRLELAFSFFGPKVARYIQSATNLLSLSVFNMEAPLDNYEIKTKTLTIMEELKIGDFELDYIGPLIECPLVSKLTFKDEEYRDDDIISTEWDDVPWIYNKVVHLQITSPKSYLEVPKFNALQKLRVDGWSRIAYRDKGGDEIFLPFIWEPTICPLLSELQLGFIPEWDLLFLMLERRNYLPQSQHISRITTLVLPFPPPPRLLIPIKETLAGRFTVRPSNPDLSVRSFVEAYFDATMWVSKFRLTDEMLLIIFHV